MKPKYYKKKPVIVRALEFTGTEENMDEIAEFIGYRPPVWAQENAGYFALSIHTLEGPHRADKGDIIIEGVAGEFYPCKAHIFEATYEEVTVYEPDKMLGGDEEGHH